MTTPRLLRPGEAVREGPVLVVDSRAAPLWRELGALPWATLTELALTARDDGGGWVVPVGAREVAALLGVNKDTAARALAALVGAGLLRRERVEFDGVGRRSAYRLVLPAGLVLCPAIPDGAAGPTQRDIGCCPQPASVCPASSDDTPPRTAPAVSAGALPEADGAPRSSAGVERGDRRGHAAVDGSAVAVSRHGADAVGVAVVSAGLSGADAPAHCRSGVGDSAPPGGAQGQLFEVAVTAGSEDQPR